MNTIGWKRLRLLVTNKCNYRCPFCHNEGQEKNGTLNMISLESFKQLIDMLKEEDLEEFHFSGGEPFLHPNIVEMIQYVCSTTKWNIGCATNLSLISKEQVESLANTRVKFNIQFPYADAKLFKNSTFNGSFDKTMNNVNLVRKYGLKVGLNSVIQSSNIEYVRNLIEFALEQELHLKLLPQIGLSGSESFKEWVFPLLEIYAKSVHDKDTGAIRWVLEKDNHQTAVLYIDSPCFEMNIKKCRNFGEVRINPDMSLQSCILRNADVFIKLEKGHDFLINQFQLLWKDFTTC